jgi:predicted DNA-binding transcriptional regulator YafY
LGDAPNARAGTRAQAEFPFDPAGVKSAVEPPEDSTRLIWMFLTLIRKRGLTYEVYARQFNRGERTFKRDRVKLEALGDKYGFKLGKYRNGRVALLALGGLPDEREKTRPGAADTLRALADALGEVVANDVGGVVDLSNAARDPFLRLAAPRLVDGSRVAGVFRELRQAWQAKAMVRFRYPKSESRGGKEQTEERTVQPHLVTYYEGRYYLVAFDVRPQTGGWRQFALDRIEGTIARLGTFKFQTVPPRYRDENFIGLFKTGGRFEVTVALSPKIAEAVLGRQWQAEQLADARPDGWATLTFEVFDLGEAVRWAFRFGPQARVVSPLEAVTLAREMASDMLAAYSEGVRYTA